jgi:hypothetical protein
LIARHSCVELATLILDIKSEAMLGNEHVVHLPGSIGNARRIIAARSIADPNYAFGALSDGSVAHLATAPASYREAT